ncbi:MAG: hypothetical protein AYK18_09475 [Theionarchaea archaeon DG-70]|nr:MAG: hypothetical protein AYK18_09475 [Theionarchaea archaeon DG-70]
MCTLQVKERYLHCKNSQGGTKKAVKGFKFFNFPLELILKFFSNLIKSEPGSVYIFSKKEEVEVIV